MPELEPVVFLIVGVVIVNGIAGRIRVPAPILLVIVGVAASFIPGVPDYAVSPELVLTVLLPPLLFAAASESSVIAFRRMLRSITQLAVGMVIVTALAVAVVLQAMFRRSRSRRRWRWVRSWPRPMRSPLSRSPERPACHGMW